MAGSTSSDAAGGPGPDGRPAPRILTTSTDAAPPPIRQRMAEVIAEGGPGGFGQVIRLLRMRAARRGFSVAEFYQYGFWSDRPERPAWRDFVAKSGTRAYNAALERPVDGLSTELIGDKLAAESLLRREGYPTTTTLAAFGPAPPPGSGAAHLRDAGDLSDCLDGAGYPIFVKARFGSFARGVAGIAARQGGGRLLLSNGVTVAQADLVAEIVRDWQAGMLVQSAARPAPEIAHVLPRAMGTTRLVTLRTAAGIGLHYAVQKLPSLTAMHDGPSRSPTASGLIDPSGGHVAEVRLNHHPYRGTITHWLDETKPIAGMVLPGFAKAVELVRAAHGLFPGHGVLGWDVFLTAEGPLLNEVNANPYPMIYQRAAWRGINDPSLRPLYEEALAHARSG